MDEGIRFDRAYETMPWHKVDAVIFDIGNVLLRFDPEEIARALFPGDGEKQRHMIECVYHAPIWQELDRGTLDCEAAARRLSAQHGYPEADYLRALRSPSALKEPIEEGWRAVRRCKRAGKRLYLLSNYACEGFEAVRARFAERFALFDGGCVSAYLHQLKPEPAIYETLIGRYALKPGRALFIDDCLPNVEAANKMGIHGIHWHETGALDRFFI